MRTAVIKHRVADFLRQHAPFDCLTLEDLLTLADTGRVSFHQANEEICRAGTPRKPYVFVVQQGRVDLYEGDSDRLRDILTAGDTIGLEGFLPGGEYLDTARTVNDVILYGLDSDTFVRIASSYPQTSQFLAAHFAARRAAAPSDLAAPSLSWTSRVPAVEGVAEDAPLWTAPEQPIREVIQSLDREGATIAIALDRAGNPLGAVTLRDAAIAIATGRACAADPISTILAPAVAAPPGASFGELFLLLIRSRAAALTAEANAKRFVITASSLSHTTLYNPVAGIDEIRGARNPVCLSRLRASTDALASAAVKGPDSIEWAGRYTAERNRAVIEQCMGTGPAAILWFGAGARAERTASTLPTLAVGYRPQDGATPDTTLGAAEALRSNLEASGFRADREASEGLPARTLEEWKAFYREVIEDPIGQEVYAKRHFLDLDLAAGDPTFLEELKLSITGQLRRHPEFVKIVAIDALAKLPPLTFYKDLVVDIEGRSSTNLHLARIAVAPIVDAARALALSALDLEHVNTIERLRRCAECIPEAHRTCLDAIDAFRVAAYQTHRHPNPVQPSMFTRYDRELLKSAFRSIAALLQVLAVRAGFQDDAGISRSLT